MRRQTLSMLDPVLEGIPFGGMDFSSVGWKSF